MYHFTRREASLAFAIWGTPACYLLDGDGRIRFEQVELEALPRLATVLSTDA